MAHPHALPFTDDSVLALNTQVAYVAELVSPLASGAQGSALQIAQYGANALVDGLPELLKVLRTVAAVHPFIELAVGAFAVAIELDLKRRENDKRINLLFLEMRDMMTALADLQNISHPAHIGKDGKTVQERLEGLIQQIDVDIRECTSACDTYAKKPLLTKVWAGGKWDEKLQQFVKRFTKRREDIELALAVHLGINIDIANRKLDTLEAKMDLALEYLTRCTPPEEKELSAFIQARGGREAILRNERLILELINRRAPSVSRTSGGRWDGRRETLDVEELKADLCEDPEISILRNKEAFERKFQMQERELAQIQKIVHEENELLAKTVSSGPHDKIRDNDLHNIWREMRWRGNVKARHFVLALRDYCLERLDKLRKNEQTYADCARPTNITEHDEWALEYISVTRLQAIVEAFDDDASGFITVAEVNTFTSSKPPGWSLLHWMAYWAIGWQMTMTHYATEIDQLLDKMFAVRRHVLPANRRSVEQYLDGVWSPITQLTTGFRRAERNDVVEERFRDYIVMEETRLRGALECVRYDIDAPDTLQLVTGPGRIEKYLFPLLYLLLKRDYEIMRLARTVIIHKDELWDSTDTIQWVLRAVTDRQLDLENLFKQQNLDPAQQFKVFACELFRYWHDPTQLWSIERLREAQYPELTYNDAEEDHSVDAARLLNHPLENPANPLSGTRYVKSSQDLLANEPLRSILGHWSGFLGDGQLFPSEPMMSVQFHASRSSSNEFVASGTSPIGTSFRISGKATQNGPDRVLYTFTLQYAARHWPKSFRGMVVDGGREFSGDWLCDGNGTRGTFLFRRLSPDAMRFWPLPTEAEANKPRRLWVFACSATLDLVRRKALSLRLLQERQSTRQRFLRIIHAGEGERSSDEAERQSLIRCYRSMTPSEAGYYHLVHESTRRIPPKHFGIFCANCRVEIAGARHMCLDCGIRTTIDLCGKAECLTATIGPDRRDDLVSPHIPSHRVLKVRRVVHRHREFGKTYRAAQAALARAEEALADAADVLASQAFHHHRRGHSRGLSEHSMSAHVKTEQLVSREISCVGCDTRVTRPCWYCIECDDECFVCTNCEAGRTAFARGHKPIHGLVRCASPQEESATTSELAMSSSRLDALETTLEALHRDYTTRLDRLENQTTALSEKLGGMQVATSRDVQALDTRLQRIEDLLATLLSKL
ncbi:hypothetical protein OH77DRAFT_1407600 [Trametes cingulata]|nr:hypothetical protein OH77DRAFT_1407600 [Trametes cingulata]